MSRNLRNSQYTTQVQKVNTLVGLVPEDGALVMVNNTIFYGDGEGWVELSVSEDGVVKWVRYDDTEHTVEAPQTFTSFPFYLENNGELEYNPYALDLYDGLTNTWTLEEGSSYILTVAFKAKISNANGYMEVYLECPTDTDYRQVGDFIIFPKGNNVEHHYSKVMQFYANSNVAEDGLKIVIDASHTGSVYECKYFIQKMN
jgi:hypothetical protein